MHKKMIILTISVIISFIILIFVGKLAYNRLGKYYYSNRDAKKYFEFAENNSETIFSVERITYFSSCNADIETNSNSSFNISNLYQYTDIAIFLENKTSDENLTAKNTLKSVVVDNINFSLSPSVGTPNLYYKNINDFASPTFSEDNLINNSIIFDTTAEDEIDYSTPILYNNCANPITFCYVNSNIKDDYTLKDNIQNISYNGSLLKSCGVTLNSISCKLSFVITITNNLDEKYTCPFILTIPLSTESSTIYDGNLILRDTTNYDFIRQQ